jgi:hypothetical protein
MKLSTWYRKALLGLAAAGWLAPSDAHAVNIALGDPSFEAFSVPAAGPTAGYAYANTYRPTSAWISRPDDNFNQQSFIDGGPQASNWIYNAAYAELSKPNAGGTANNPGQIAVGHRPAPRTGNQAMHGRGHFSGQEIPASTAVFEAGKKYTFSIYAQGDSNAEIYSTGWQSRVYLFIYDATVSLRNPAVPASQAYSDPNGFVALTYDPSLHDEFSENFMYFPPDRFAPDEPVPPENTATHPGQFINRPVAATAAQSKAAWQQISISWLAFPGAAEIGHPMGVAFRAIDDAALDDAALTATGAGVGDLNVDGIFNAADWNLLRSNQFGNLSALTPQQRYLAGDLNADGLNNFADFALFKTAYVQANGVAAFQALVASVPEPAMATLAATAGVFVACARRRSRS